MSRLCPVCGPEVPHADDVTVCPKHVRPTEPYEEPFSTPEADEPPPESTACWNCGTEPPDPANTECLEPHCRRSLTPPAMMIRFSNGQVEVDRDSRVELGRLGRHARLFRSFPNVSRRHAVVGVDRDGSAWIEPVPTPNGTFVDGREIEPSIRCPLHARQKVRFARDAEGTVTLFSRFSRGGRT